MKAKQYVRARTDQVLAKCTIPKGTIGHIARASPRLKDSIMYELGPPKDVVIVKFPGVPAFFCNRETDIELIH